ncbi:MAG TPA: DUF87 domain-containing protein [Candidatus Faecisoma merdavium]|nr:DUF87 domain-containing protein [Candidatus Faecisoma merdavium]
MLGHIIGIVDEQILLKLAIDITKFENLVNVYVIIEDNNKKIIGEIIDIKDGIAYINLLGELINDKFVFGVMVKPSFSSTVKLISKEKVPMIISIDNYQEDKDVYFGTSPVYEGVKIGVNINQFFSSHFAILGSTGSGKSCGVARIIQNIFDKKRFIPYKASLFIFDAYGEYHNSFKNIGSEEISFKAYTTKLQFSETEIIKIPLWLLDVDDIALLLNATSVSQLPIIEKAIKLVKIFARDDVDVVKYKNDIIARALLDILSSGNPPAQIRDQIFSILSFYNTNELNLDTPIFQPGYTRPLKQCLLIDASGKIREMELLTNFIEKFIDDNLQVKLPDADIMYTLEDLEKAFAFALISEGILNSDKVYDESNVLKVRLHSIVNSEYKKYFDYDKFITKEQYIKELLIMPNGRKAQIINFNINYVDDRFAKVLVKIYSKLLFNYSKESANRATLPFHILLEEAHRYVQNDIDTELLGYNIFDRITKEGRKYGVLLGLISQRPSELSETSLSQCSNFLIFKMLHPVDVEYIRKMVPNITNEITKRLRILQPGNCIAFGSAFKVPVMIKLDMPNPAPSSSSCDISKNWFIEKK